jgi:hypothetical protein
MSGYGVISEMPVVRFLPVEGIGLDVIQAPKREPRIMRYELTVFEWAAMRSFLPNTVRWKPSFFPRTRDHPVGFGYRKYFAVVKHGRHGAAYSQVTVERVIKTTSVELSQRIQELWIQNRNGKPRTGIRLAARTIAGAHIRKAAAPMKMFLRVIR